MDTFRGFESLPRFERPVVTVGSFDGIHRGHRALLDTLRREAAALAGESVVLTFEPHPRITLGRSEGLRLLNTLAEKRYLLERSGIDHLLVVTFDEAFSRLSPYEFVQHCLIGKLGAAALIVGYDHRFGRGNEGNHDFLNRQQFPLRIVEVPECGVDAAKVSSTVVRRLIAQGEMAQAERLLGHPYPVAGTVRGGVIRPDPLKLLPPTGSYAVRIGGAPCVAEIASDGAIRIHPHLPDGEVLLTFQPC